MLLVKYLMRLQERGREKVNIIQIRCNEDCQTDEFHENLLQVKF